MDPQGGKNSGRRWSASGLICACWPGCSWIPGCKASSIPPIWCSRRSSRRSRRWTGSSSRSDAELAAWLRQILAHNLANAARDLGPGQTRRGARMLPGSGPGRNPRPAWKRGWRPSNPPPASRPSARSRSCAWRRPWPSLPEAQREALTRRYLQSWSLDDIGRHLGRSPAAVAGLIKRGLKQLRLLLHESE